MSRHHYAYIRVSTVKQGEKGSSLQEQRAAIESYARKFNLTIGEWFEEQETAAKRGRPQFNRLMSLLRKGQGHGVVIHKIDRSARNLKDWADIGELIDAGIDIHFAHESLDLQSRGGRLAADIQAVVASDFIRNLRDEVRKGIQGRLKQGLYPGRAPTGYLDTGKGKPKLLDPIRGPLVRRAFEMCATGDYNLVMLVNELHSLGLTNSSGGKMTVNTLTRILRNPFYYGLIYIQRTGQSFAGIHEPLVSKALYDEVQDHISGRKRQLGLKRDYLFQKKLRCYDCNRTLIPEIQKGRTYYRCHEDGVLPCTTRCVREDLITRQLLQYICAFDVSETVIAKLEIILSRMQLKSADHATAERKAITLLRISIDDRLRKLTDAYLDEAVDRSTYDTRRHDLLSQRLVADDKLKTIEVSGSQRLLAARDYIELLKALNNKLIQQNPEDAVRMVKKITSNLHVFGKRLVPTWKLPADGIAPEVEMMCGEPFEGIHRTLDEDALIKWAESINAGMACC